MIFVLSFCVFKYEGYKFFTTVLMSDKISLACSSLKAGIIKLNDIALVLSDYRMQEMSGTELLENVKHMYPDTIRVIFSGHFDQAVLMKAIGKVQVHGVLPKPWKDEEVEFTVARWTEQYKRAKRLEEKAEQCVVVQKQLEKANELIEQLMQELKEASTSEHQQMGFWRRWKRKRG